MEAVRKKGSNYSPLPFIDPLPFFREESLLCLLFPFKKSKTCTSSRVVSSRSLTCEEAHGGAAPKIFLVPTENKRV